MVKVIVGGALACPNCSAPPGEGQVATLTRKVPSALLTCGQCGKVNTTKFWLLIASVQVAE